MSAAEILNTAVRVRKGSGDRLYVIVCGENDSLAERISGFPAGQHLMLVSCRDWNADLSPWPAPACFRGGADFAGRADAFLRLLTQDILPAAVSNSALSVSSVSILGYSLAGLFALYAMYKSPVFTSAASVSGSLWYPHFTEFLKNETPAAQAKFVYLSVGDREANTKNPVLCRVADKTREAACILEEKGIRTRLEFNPGNHFFEPDARMLRAICALSKSGEAVSGRLS